MLKKHVVIVGGGWAGIRLARKLKKLADHQIKITLISNEPNFRYTGGLYRVATGHKERPALIPIHELISDIPHASFVRGTLQGINTAKKIITTSNGTEYHYDYAVIAIGSVTTYFGIPGIEEHAYGIKTQKELRQFRTHIHQELTDVDGPEKNYVVVGAGPTGVELSAGMASYIKSVRKRHGIHSSKVNIELIEAAPRVLPVSHPNASKKTLKQLRKLGVKVKLNSKVEYETDTSLVVSGRSIPTQTVIWTAGVANNPFFAKYKKTFSLNNRGKVLVDDRLRVNKDLYVIGDNAVTPYSGLALTAVHNANYVAKDIIKRIHGEKQTPTYKPQTPATIIPVGKRWAILQYKSFTIGGIVGAAVRAFADLVAYNDIAKPSAALSYWAHSEDLEEQCFVCKSALTDKQGIVAGLSEPY
jgi:NADH dehydrogenase